jgi:predicted alpha/beta-hydrolase family hydrolase
VTDQLVETPVGPARITWVAPAAPSRSGLLLLGHGAGGGVGAADLQAVAIGAAGAGLRVGLVEQPYRVAGRRAPAPARQLDEAWHAVIAHVRRDGERLVLGGRSSGARVACRVADSVGAVGVVCLAFPLHPPGRPERSRLTELTGVAVPRLVVQGERDAFGGYAELEGALAEVHAEGVEVCRAQGADHALRKGVPVEQVIRWIVDLVDVPAASAG